MTTLDAFKSRIEQFLLDWGMAERTFGLSACKDTAFVRDLREGREPRQSTIEKVERFMREHEQAQNAATTDDQASDAETDIETQNTVPSESHAAPRKEAAA